MNFDNRFDLEDFLFNLFFIFMLFAVSAGFICIPFSVFYNTQATQKAINKECKTNYTFKEVLFAGDDLLKLCQTKQQTITIK